MNALEAKRKAKQRIYLQALADLKHVAQACAVAGVHRTAPIHWRQRYEDFRQAEQAVLWKIATGGDDDHL